jgi:hypothetical protein
MFVNECGVSRRLEILFAVLAKTSLAWFSLLILFGEKDFKTRFFSKKEIPVHV